MEGDYSPVRSKNYILLCEVGIDQKEIKKLDELYTSSENVHFSRNQKPREFSHNDIELVKKITLKYLSIKGEK